MKNSKLFINSFVLKLLALITMTIDHIGVLIATSNDDITRIIGRIALPLFIFMAVEGAIKTSNAKKYILRMSITALLVAAALTYMSYFMSGGKAIAYSSGNIFIDLLLVVLIVRILLHPNKKMRLILIPIILYSIYSYTVTKIEGCGCHGYFEWFPAAIRMQYSIYSILLCFAFYYAKDIAKMFLQSFAKNANAPEDLYLDENNLRFATNIISVLLLFVITFGFVILNSSFGEKYLDFLGNTQLYAMVASIFILFYNGSRGYNAKWFKYACYAYYPLHILILAAIFM